MRRRSPIALFCALVCAGALLAAPGSGNAAGCTSVASESGIGGTGLGDPDSGIGGTGLGDPDDGIGGTGVYGTITGFASICVNGLEVHYAPDVRVTWNGASASARDLAVGHVVWIVADPADEAEEPDDRGEQLIARSIAVSSALVGNIDRFDAELGLLEVGGELVEVPGEAWVFGEQRRSLADSRGALVEVSGLRRADGRLVASRIDRTQRSAARPQARSLAARLGEASDLRRVSIEGYVETAEATRLRVAGVEVDWRHEQPTAAPRVGTRVRVDGALRDGVVRADRIVSDRPPRDGASRPPEPAPLPPEPDPNEVRPPDAPRPDRVKRPELPPRIDLPPRLIRPESFDRPLTP